MKIDRSVMMPTPCGNGDNDDHGDDDDEDDDHGPDDRIDAGIYCESR